MQKVTPPHNKMGYQRQVGLIRGSEEVEAAGGAASAPHLALAGWLPPTHWAFGEEDKGGPPHAPAADVVQRVLAKGAATFGSEDAEPIQANLYCHPLRQASLVLHKTHAEAFARHGRDHHAWQKKTSLCPFGSLAANGKTKTATLGLSSPVTPLETWPFYPALQCAFLPR